MSKFVISSSLP